MNAKLFAASLFAFAGILSGRIASSDEQHEWVAWSDVATDSIEAGKEFIVAWGDRKGKRGSNS